MRNISIIAALFFKLGFGFPSNEIEKAVGFGFVKYEIEAVVNHWHDSSGVEREFQFKATRTGDISIGDSSELLAGIDSVRVNMGLEGRDPLCGCEGCYSKNRVAFFGLKNRKVDIEYGACGGNFEVARFKKGKKRYLVHFSKEQAEKIGLVFKRLAKEGIKEIDSHDFGG